MRNCLWLGIFAVTFLSTSASASVFGLDLMGRSGAGMRFDNENPSASGSGTGGEVGAGISYDDVLNQLTINVGWGSGQGFTNLTGNVTVAHIHAAPDALFTSNGGVIVNLDGATPGFNNSGTNGGWSNTQVTLSASQETQLFNGQLYLNAHTSANGGGEIRGNMIVPEPATGALLLIAGLLVRRTRRG
jgi:hypothetical protein